MNVLFRPIAKIRLNCGYFETEPDTGIFSGWEEVIGGHIGPGWEDLPIAGSGLPRVTFGEPEIKKGRFFLKDRICPDNQTTGISFAVFFPIGICAGKFRTLFVYVRTGLPEKIP
jgi:hypothetical protein